MKIFVIVGAGKGLGLSLAKRFGKEAFHVCLIARNEDKLEEMTKELSDLGISSDYYIADVYKKDQIEAAFAAIKREYGFIDVLEFSPTPGMTPPTSVLNLTDEMVLEQFNGMVAGAINSVNQVLPDMIAQQKGALLFTTGLSSIFPVPMMGNIGIALSGLRNYILNLSTELKDKGIYVGHLALGLIIQPESGEITDPNVIADFWYNMYLKGEVNEATLPEGVTPTTIIFPKF